MASIEPVALSSDRTPRASRTRINSGSASAIAMTRTTPTNAGRRHASNTTGETASDRRVVTSRSPSSAAATAATTTHSTSSGSARAMARLKSYSAAKAVNTSVVYTRTRSNPGTPNSDTASTKMIRAAATTLGATSGRVMPRSTRPGDATISASLLEAAINPAHGHFGGQHRQRIQDQAQNDNGGRQAVRPFGQPIPPQIDPVQAGDDIGRQ